MINPNELSFCIQGPFIVGQTDLLIIKLRALFPESEIVYAIWEGDLPNFDHSCLSQTVKLVPLTDPGSFICEPKSQVYLNAQRQIYSSRKALHSATQKFAIKIRSDLFVKNTNILAALNELNTKRLEQGIQIGESRIGVLNVTSINPRFGPKMPYHLCDWLYFGLRSDLLQLFATDYPEKDFASWYERLPKPKHHVSLSNARYATESFIFSNYVRRYINIDFQNSFDCDNANIAISEKIITNNICIYRLKDLGVEMLKTENRKLLRFQDQMYQPFDLQFLRSEIGYYRYMVIRALFKLKCKLFN